MTMSGLTAKGVPPQPAFLRILKFVIIFLSVIVLALAAYAISVFSGYYGYYGSSGVAGLLIFAVIKTWIIFGVALFLEFRAQHFFFRILLLIAYVISIIFWLSAWAWSASAASLWLSYAGDFDCSYDSNFNYVCDQNGSNPWKREGAALAACAGLGALIWILLIVHLVFFILACMRDPTTHNTNNAELGQVKAQEAYPSQQPYPQQAQPVHNQGAYEQQPYQQPHQQTYPAQ